jgi:hypothetical protein
VFTRLTRAPVTILLSRKDNDIFSVEADKSFDTRETILSQLGKSMERMLTCTRNEFQTNLIQNQDQFNPSSLTPETYFYGKAESFLLRAQLDCQHPSLPRTTFDLKTRATLAIRMDADNYHENLLYHIKYSHGLFASFEREYYDMLRAAFMKYSLQVRIGQMDGIFVAFHNTARVFGFQYISLEEMDSSLFGSSTMGDQSFALSVQLLDKVLNQVVGDHSNSKYLRVTFAAEDCKSIFVEEVTDPSVVDLSVLDPKHEAFNPPKVTQYELIISNTINGNEINVNEYPNLSTGDVWSVNFDLRTVADSDHVYFDYYRIRHNQDVKQRRNRTSGSGITKRMRSHYITEDEHALIMKDSKKYIYATRHPHTSPVDSDGLVLNEGWST